MPDRQPKGDGPALLREVTLHLRHQVAAPGRPPGLVVRVWAQAGEAGRCFELRAEDLTGNVRFSYRDARRLEVLEEFECTVAELLEEYAPDGEARVVHG